MKLYTLCDKANTYIDTNTSFGIIKEEYSYSDYLKFVEDAKKYYVHMHRYYYETDMSDSDSGTIYDDYPINYSNMIN